VTLFNRLVDKLAREEAVPVRAAS
ncbi:MAG: hypothetical protein JWM38_457, partial [Sphingomonas bacterium]|nr:hypothetical protein [Sphingomonas bacterium]